MPEGESKDDLFEDLDKFFAPIQDVDWPEAQPPAGEPSEAEEPGATDDATSLEPPGAPGEEEETGGPEELFEETPEPTQEGRLPVEHETEELISVESLTQAPSAYVGLPGAEVEEERVSELEEPEGPESEEGPSPEAVEAAAEHFAESVRDEARTEPEPSPEPGPTDTSLPDLLRGPDEVEEQILAGLGDQEQPVRVKVGGEGLGGPSWQEPTAMEVGADHERRPSGRNMPAAFLTGIVLAALAAGSIAIAKEAFAVVASVIVLWAQGELYRALQTRHYQPATALGLVSGALVLAAAYYRGEAAMLSMLVLSVVATFLWFMATPATHRKNVVSNIGLTVLGVAYGPLLAGYALTMLRAPDGRGLVVSVIGLTVAYDTAAFIVGSWWGSRPLAPTISPKKSIEGAIGATLIVIALSVGLVAPYVDTLQSLGRSVGLALVVAVFAPLGDLAESLLKRDLGLKDMGSILPGHGGVLDRIDSVLFVVPAAFMFLRFILS
ncbi:MAG TPA: phosphatidate cytidylyltransferase [Actinomycetota bacterium]